MSCPELLGNACRVGAESLSRHKARVRGANLRNWQAFFSLRRTSFSELGTLFIQSVCKTLINKQFLCFTLPLIILKVSNVKHPLSIIRRVAGLSQHRFATRVNCSPGTLAAVETGKARLPEDAAYNIAAATGCSPSALLDKPPRAVSFSGKPYGPSTYKNWRAIRVGSTNAESVIEQANRQVETLLRAAFDNSAGDETPHKFRALGLLLGNWLEAKKTELGLGDRALAILRQRYGKTDSEQMTLGALRKRLERAAPFQQNDDKSLPDSMSVNVVVETYPDWTPLMQFGRDHTQQKLAFCERHECVINVLTFALGNKPFKIMERKFEKSEITGA